MDFLLLEDISAISGERLWVTGPRLLVSVDRGDALPVDPMRGVQDRVFRSSGVKYSMSFFFSFVDCPRCQSRRKSIIPLHSLGPGISATNSTELSGKLESSGDNSCSLKSIVEPMAEGNECRLHHRVAVYIGYTGRTEEQRRHESVLVASVLAVFVFACVPPLHKHIVTQLLRICWHAAKHLANK